MRILDRGLIYDASQAPDQEKVACFTNLCRLDSGRLLASFQVGPQKNSPTANVRLCKSTDDGRSWQAIPYRFATRLDGVPGSIAAGSVQQAAPGRLIAIATWFDRSDPDRPLFDPVTEGILHGRQLICFSTDEGESWSDWKDLDTPGLTGRATCGPIVRWPDGSLAYAFESFKDYDDPRPARHAAWAVVSRDGGQTFGPPYLVAQHPEHRLYYWDQRICEGPAPGDFLALFWTHDLKEQRDLNVHLRQGNLGQPLAAGDIRSTSMPGQIAAPLWLPDGRWLAFVVDRHRPGTLKLWSSSDRGATWPERDALCIHTHDEQARLSQGLENVDFKQYWEDMAKWSFGHPALCQLNPEQVLAAYYAGTPDRMSVHWARVELGP